MKSRFRKRKERKCKIVSATPYHYIYNIYVFVSKEKAYINGEDSVGIPYLQRYNARTRYLKLEIKEANVREGNVKVL